MLSTEDLIKNKNFLFSAINFKLTLARRCKEVILWKGLLFQNLWQIGLVKLHRTLKRVFKFFNIFNLANNFAGLLLKGFFVVSFTDAKSVGNSLCSFPLVKYCNQYFGVLFVLLGNALYLVSARRDYQITRRFLN